MRSTPSTPRIPTATPSRSRCRPPKNSPPAAIAAPHATNPPVCNEAENSFQGGYTVAPGVDPNPPAFLRGEQMAVGQGHGAGLVNAAAHSPALSVCGIPQDADTGGGGFGGSST